MEASALFLLPLFLPLFGPHAPERRDVQSSATQSQQVEHFLCPVATVDCPETVISPGVPVKFTARVRGAGDAPSLTLTWTVSAGTIISGQQQTHISTPDSSTEITVDTTGVPRGTNVTAAVKVTGLPRSCAVEASCWTVIPAGGDPRAVDEYGNIKFSDEQARLDNFAFELQNDPTTKGYIFCYGGRRGRRGEAAARCERAKKYLVSRRAIDAGRLITINGGFRENLTVVLWALPSWATPPTPSPTVDPHEVQFIEGPRKARRRTARRRRGGE